MSQKIAGSGTDSPSAPSDLSARVTRALLACGVVAGPLFILVVVIQEFSRAGFDLGRHPPSLLSLGDLGWIQITNFVVAGLLAIAFAVGVRRVLHPGRAGTWGPLLVGAYGVGLIMAGVFVPDASLGFPPGTPEGTPETLSLSAVLHGIGFTLAFGSTTMACLVFASRYAALKRRGWVAYSVATAVAALALSMWPSQDGASVRYFLAAVIVWAWTSVIAARLRTEHTARTDPSMRTLTHGDGAEVRPDPDHVRR